MLKSEALGQLSAIADDDNRDFEDFAAAYKTMEEVVKEYPELSHYVLPIVVQTAADKGFNADIRPAAARVFNAAALNLPAEDVVKNVVHAFKRCPSFAYYLMPDLLSGRPELSAALFPEAEAGLAKIEANCVYSAAAAAKAALLCASDREAAAMLDSAFRPAKEKEDFSRVLYRSLGQIYSRHPALKEQIFSLLETPRLLKPQNYDAFYSNLGQIGLFDAGERGRVIGLLSSYLQKGDNTPASLTAAYKAVGEMMAAADDKRELETVMRTGLQNAANDTVSRKTAWRLLGDYGNLCSRVSFCRRVEKSADNEFGLQRVETIDAGELGVLLLGGDGTRSEKALNGYLGDVYRLLKEHGLHEKAAVYGVVYDFGDFMNVGFARRRQMEKYGRNIRIDRELSPETTDPKYVGEIFDKFLLPRISTDRCPAGTEKSGCYAIEGGLKSKWRAYELTAQAAADGEVKIVLKSPVRDGRITRTDFRGLKINGREMFRGERAFSVMHPYEYTTKIKKGETLRLAFEARRHRFAFADLKEYGINFCMLFTVTVVSFLLAYGLVAYVSRFKLLEHGSRIDIVFVCVFFFLLLVPASKISREEKSVQENRRLAAYVPLFSDQGLNNRFGQDFEAWFNDRFNYREAVISFYSGLEMLLNSRINNKVAFFNKKTHWLFNNEQLKIRKLSRQTEDRVLRELSAAGRFFRRQGIKTYMLMVPGKIDIYAKAAEPYYKVRGIQNEGTIKRMMSELPFPVVYPLAELQEGAKENFVFFKTEHHWTEWGAYLGYRKLMQTIAKDFPAAGAVGEDAYDIFYKRRVRGDWDREDFTLGQTFVQMNVKYPEDKLLDVEYKYYNPKKVLAEDVNDTEMTKHYHNPDGNGLRVMLIGTSMSENLLQFLPQNFSELKYFRTNNSPIVPVAEEKKIMKRYKREILEYKPDILVFCFTISNIPGFVKFNED